MRQWFLLLLMAMVGVNTAYADEKDMGDWSENSSFGQNGANLTWDGYSLWDGQSFQNYELRTSVSYCGILCGYAENTNTRYPTFRNCRVTNCSTGIENGSTYVGGIVGYAEYISLYDKRTAP